MFESSKPRAGGAVVSDGSVILMKVDLNKFEVEWQVDGKMQTKAIIPTEMRAYPLFFFVLLVCPGDEVEMLL